MKNEAGNELPNEVATTWLMNGGAPAPVPLRSTTLSFIVCENIFMRCSFTAKTRYKNRPHTLRQNAQSRSGKTCRRQSVLCAYQNL